MHLHQREAAAILAVVGLDDISTNTTAGLVRQQPSLKRRRAAYSSNTSPNTYGHTSCVNIRGIALESITSSVTPSSSRSEAAPATSPASEPPS